MSRVIITPLFLLYSPLGLFLVIIRSLLLIYVFLASAILYSVPPLKRVVLRLMCAFLGFVVTSEGKISCSKLQPLVSNCATLFDHMLMSLLINCVTPHKFMLSWALTWRPLNYDESDCINRIRDVFHIQPEEIPTGLYHPYLLKFNAAPFRLFNSVQPVSISLSTSLPINLSVHPIDWRYEIFWLLFTPFVRVHVTFLEPLKKNSETDEDFSDNVRQKIAKNLKKRIVDLDKDKFLLALGESESMSEPLKELNVQSKLADTKGDQTSEVHNEANNCNNQPISNKDPRLEQVLAVIPNSNVSIVEALLNRFGDVDIVIAKLLEHSPEMTANIDKVDCDSIKKVSCKYLSPSCHRLAADTFSRDTNERHKSFADRKVMFLENARQRYLEVHPEIKV